jgi:hypothetical protein
MLQQTVVSPTIAFWETGVPNSGWDYIYCITRRDAVVAAMDKVLASGVQEYHVGSRGLTRLSLRDLQDLLVFWTNAANSAALGYSSAIQTRRGVPCDV